MLPRRLLARMSPMSPTARLAAQNVTSNATEQVLRPSVHSGACCGRRRGRAPRRGRRGGAVRGGPRAGAAGAPAVIDAAGGGRQALRSATAPFHGTGCAAYEDPPFILPEPGGRILDRLRHLMWNVSLDLHSFIVNDLAHSCSRPNESECSSSPSSSAFHRDEPPGRGAWPRFSPIQSAVGAENRCCCAPRLPLLAACRCLPLLLLLLPPRRCYCYYPLRRRRRCCCRRQRRQRQRSSLGAGLDRRSHTAARVGSAARARRRHTHTHPAPVPARPLCAPRAAPRHRAPGGRT